MSAHNRLEVRYWFIDYRQYDTLMLPRIMVAYAMLFVGLTYLNLDRQATWSIHLATLATVAVGYYQYRYMYLWRRFQMYLEHLGESTSSNEKQQQGRLAGMEVPMLDWVYEKYEKSPHYGLIGRQNLFLIGLGGLILGATTLYFVTAARSIGPLLKFLIGNPIAIGACALVVVAIRKMPKLGHFLMHMLRFMLGLGKPVVEQIGSEGVTVGAKNVHIPWGAILFFLPTIYLIDQYGLVLAHAALFLTMQVVMIGVVVLIFGISTRANQYMVLDYMSDQLRDPDAPANGIGIASAGQPTIIRGGRLVDDATD